MAEAHNKNMHMVIGGALLLIGAFVIIALVLVYSQAAPVQTTTTITQATPVLGDPILHANSTPSDYTSPIATFVPNTNSDKLAYVKFTVTDANGWANVTHASAAVYRSSQTQPTIIAERVGSNKWFTDETDGTNPCTFSTKDNDEAYVVCPVVFKYYTDSTVADGQFAADNWVIKVETEDAELNADTTHGVVTFEVAENLAAFIPGAINFGTKANGYQTAPAAGINQTITQQGNVQADLQITTADTASCTTAGSIPDDNIKFSMADLGWADAGKTTLNIGAADYDFNLMHSTDSGDTQKPMYWDVLVPFGAQGTCTNDMTITLLDDSAND